MRMTRMHLSALVAIGLGLASTVAAGDIEYRRIPAREYRDKMKVMLQLVNQPSGWSFEAAAWARIAIESR